MSFHTPPPGSYANYLEEKRNRTNQNSNYAREIKSLLSFFFRMWFFEKEKKLFLQFQSKRMKSLSSTGRVLLFWIQQVEIDLRKTIFWWICDMENHKLLTVIKRKCHTQPMSLRIRKENYSFSTLKVIRILCNISTDYHATKSWMKSWEKSRFSLNSRNARNEVFCRNTLLHLIIG